MILLGTIRGDVRWISARIQVAYKRNPQGVQVSISEERVLPFISCQGYKKKRTDTHCTCISLFCSLVVPCVLYFSVVFCSVVYVLQEGGNEKQQGCWDVQNKLNGLGFRSIYFIFFHLQGYCRDRVSEKKKQTTAGRRGNYNIIMGLGLQFFVVSSSWYIGDVREKGAKCREEMRTRKRPWANVKNEKWPSWS